MCAAARSVRGERGTLSWQECGWIRPTRFAPVVFTKGTLMNRIIYIIGAVVVIIAILSFFGLR